MADQAPFLDDAPVDPQADQRRWALAVFLSFVVAGLGGLLAWALPPIYEGYWEHAPAMATVTGRETQVRHLRDEGRHETDFHHVTWIDDQGKAHRDLLQVGWRTYAPGTPIEVHYALSPDGSTRWLWERRLHPALILLALLIATAAATLVALWIQALRAVFRGPPAPAPTPDNGPNP